NTVMLPGHEMVGGVVSLTVKLVLHVDALPAASVAVIVTGCGPQPTTVPAAGDCVSVTPLQLSEATVVAVKSGTAAEQAVTDCGGAQVVIVGGVVSTTWKCVTHEVSLSFASAAVIVTFVVPRPTSVPGGGDCVIEATPQLSVATSV